MHIYGQFNTPFGLVEATINKKMAITRFCFINNYTKTTPYNPLIRKDGELLFVKTQIDEYFAKKRIKFDLLLDPQGTDFQKNVWQELLKIPYGKTISYKDIALAVGNKLAVRAIGNANALNPIMLIIPCHRVIGTNNKLTGYAAGITLKEQLLKLENNYFTYQK